MIFLWSEDFPDMTAIAIELTVTITGRGTEISKNERKNIKTRRSEGKKQGTKKEARKRSTEWEVEAEAGIVTKREREFEEMEREGQKEVERGVEKEVEKEAEKKLGVGVESEKRTENAVWRSGNNVVILDGVIRRHQRVPLHLSIKRSTCLDQKEIV